MPLVRTSGASAIVARAQVREINAPGGQDTLLTGPSRIQKGRYKSRKGWSWPGVLVETKITSFVAGRR